MEVVDVAVAFVVATVIVHGSNLIERRMCVWGAKTLHKNEKRRYEGRHGKATRVGKEES